MVKKILENNEKATMQVLVVGNVTVDETYSVPSTLRPGESLIGQFRSRDVGNKGANVATVLARCGVSTWLVAGIGQDECGMFVQQALAQESMQIDLVLQGNLSQTTTHTLIGHAKALGIIVVLNPSPCADCQTAILQCRRSDHRVRRDSVSFRSLSDYVVDE